MLEYLTICAYVENRDVNKKLEDIKLSKYMKHIYEPETSSVQISYVVYTLISLTISILTAMLAYKCNLKSDIVYKIIATLFGFFFSFIYLLYYIIRHVMFGQKC